MKAITRTPLHVLYLICILGLLWLYQQNYRTSIHWKVNTQKESITTEGLNLTQGLLDDQSVFVEKYLLLENYYGSKIRENAIYSTFFLVLSWIGIACVLVSASYFKRLWFIIYLGLFALLINRLNLDEIGFWGLKNKLAVFIPFLLISAPLIYIYEIKKNTPFIWRWISVLIAIYIASLGLEDFQIHRHHLVAHSLFSLTIGGIIFLFLISGEILFAILFFVSKNKGGKNNHLHFIFLSLIYLGNLLLSYLNVSNYFQNSFFYFDPFILLFTSSAIALWSHRHGYFFKKLPPNIFTYILIGLGIILFSVLNLSMSKGNDAVYEAFHYFILYFHIGIGIFFFFYVILNFLDPLSQGFRVYKIIPRERNFPYLSAMLGGLITTLALFLLTNKEPYHLLMSGYYNYLSDYENAKNDKQLAKQYLVESSFHGYNTHYTQYQLAWDALESGNQLEAKNYFKNASERNPSPFAAVNYANLHQHVNPNKSQAFLELMLHIYDMGEIKNNIGMIHLKKRSYRKALNIFRTSQTSKPRNQVPLVNKWYVSYLATFPTIPNDIQNDYYTSNYGVRANIISNQKSFSNSITFIDDGLENSSDLYRKAYLLNATSYFKNDSIEHLALKELTNTTDGEYKYQLQRALVVYYYKKGDINKVFKMLDDLQANANQFEKGEYLDILGKIALTQGAYQLSLDYFENAIKTGYLPSKMNKIEALACVNKKNEVQYLLSEILRKDTAKRKQINLIVAKLDSFIPPSITFPKIKIDDLSIEELKNKASQNAFDINAIIEITDYLNKKNESAAYDLLIDAIEINPYASPLLKKYILLAVDWGLIDYANEVLENLKTQIPKTEFNNFLKIYEKHLQDNSQEVW